MASRSLKDVATHFAFGENWASYAHAIDPERIAEAERGLTRLVGRSELAGQRFLDIGCGSGIHSLAALRLGATDVVALDIDAHSVATTTKVLKTHVPNEQWCAREISIFDIEPDTFGSFGVVYSWGVLHHTGSMFDAIERASRLVRPSGLFIFALYRKTSLCWAWKIEKRWYKSASIRTQRIARAAFIKLMQLDFARRGEDFAAYVTSYLGRGMDYMHDIHDWLGGFPYESTTPTEVSVLMDRLDFEPVRTFTQPGGLGIFGSGCDEYVYRRLK